MTVDGGPVNFIDNKSHVSDVLTRLYNKEKDTIVYDRPLMRQISAALDNKNVLLFVILWNVFEAKCVHKEIEGKSLYEDVEQFANNNYNQINVDSLKDHLRFFHERYHNNPAQYEALLGDRKDIELQYEIKDVEGLQTISGTKLFEKDYNFLCALNNNNKVSLMLFIIQRVRNNIFHGSKSPIVWENDYHIIQNCLDALIQVTFNTMNGGMPKIAYASK